MPETAKQQSNPYSTGGGGVNFETRVQAAFTVLMLTGRIAPCLPPFPITKIKLQGHYAGFNTDDFIVFSKQPETEKVVKLLAQIKHAIGITAGDTTFAEVIQSTWNDFNDENFDSSVDALALITGPLSATDIDDVRPILEWARHSEDETEFFTKIKTANFSSDAKRKKLAAFKIHLKNANEGIDVPDRQVWEFLKVFHLIGYDLDTESGGTLSLLHSLIAQYSNEAAPSVWARVVDVVQISNQNAGTIALETLPEDIRTKFSTANYSNWSSDLSKLREHGNYILGVIRTTIGGIHIKQSDTFDRLLNLAETSSFILVSGERGAGKSSLVRKFSDYMGERAPIFCLRTEDLDRSHLDNVFSAMGLKGSLRDLEAGFALMPKKYLLIESLEKLLELEKTTAFIDLLHFLNKQQGWTIIATGRDYAYQQITFTYLQPHGIKFAPLTLNGFSNEQVRDLCEQIEPLQKFSNNPNLKILLKSPFFADLACRVLETGTEFTPEDGEKEFRDAVWRDAIAKEQERANGMPTKRRQTFIDIAVRRAKQMVYGVPDTLFDENAVLKLEEDNLVRRNKNGLVSPAHDLLEDWALDRYIEKIYQQYSGNIQDFLNTIGNEPAINRAFRLWLHQKLRYGDNVDDFVLAVLSDRDIQRYWQDETIAAILQGDNPSEFLNLLKNKLFLEDGELLKRFCFILRIACQIPETTLASNSIGDEIASANILFLKPYGQGWKAIVYFLFENKELFSEDLIPHIIAILKDLSSSFKLNEELPIASREAGLIALYLKETHENDKNREELISIIIKSISVISEEFLDFLKTNIIRDESSEQLYVPNQLMQIMKFSDKNAIPYYEKIEKINRPYFTKVFYTIAFNGIESAFFCKHNPDTLIELAFSEWLISESQEANASSYQSIVNIDHYFRLHEHPYHHYVSPSASGAEGPFKYLLCFHPRKGLDFIIQLLNITAEEYANSDLDSPCLDSPIQENLSETVFNLLTIQLNDGTRIQQYCSWRLWGAYRGLSLVPHLLKSALMALENWLIEYVKNSEFDEIEWLFDYILRKSNSIMPTAILASIATGFHERVGKSALPLLRVPELYSLDIKRLVHEHESGYCSFRSDSMSQLYTKERHVSNSHLWRKEHLENLIVNLQLSEWRDEAISVVDTLQAFEPKNENLRFLLKRIDSRAWKPIADYENNRIIIKSADLEPDLMDSLQRTSEEFQGIDRYSRLATWSRKKIENKPLEGEYFLTWKEAIAEAKFLHEEFSSGRVSDFAKVFYCGITDSVVVFMRDFSQELDKDDVQWCAKLIIQVIKDNTDNSERIVDIRTYNYAIEAVSALPVLLDFATDEEEKISIKKLIAEALTHTNVNVRHKVSDGIRQHLWQRDPIFAQKCVIGAIEYAYFRREQDSKIEKIYYLDDNKKEVELAKIEVEKSNFCDQFIKGTFPTKSEKITLQTHDSYYLLSPVLMIPDGSRKSSHQELFLRMLNLLFEDEQQENIYSRERRNKVRIHHEISSNFTKSFARYLFSLHDSNFKDFIDLLRIGCEIAPKFIRYLILCVAVEAEKENADEIYWQLWKELSQTVQQIVIKSTNNNFRDHSKELIRGMLHADSQWQKNDYEEQYIILGKDLLLEFVKNTGKNPDVFEALSSLIYHFPLVFFEKGIHVLSKHQKDEGGTHLLTVNTVFYLEIAIQHFLQIDQTGTLKRIIHESCFVLLDAIVETASSRAYHLREHLIRSRRIV